MTRQEARRLIVETATKRRRHPDVVGPYRMRHLHIAVRKCRAFRLVKPEVLIAAGFNPTGPNERKAK